MSLLDLHREIAAHADEIKKLFKDRVHVTIVVRNPDHVNRNAFVTDDPVAETEIIQKPFIETMTGQHPYEDRN